MRESRENFLYLNADNRWPAFQWDGLELRPDGALQLFSLPRVDGVWKAERGENNELVAAFVPETAVRLIGPSLPAGIVTDWDGTIYVSDPTANRVLRIFEGESIETVVFADSLHSPRGLWIEEGKRRLLVADRRNPPIVP